MPWLSNAISSELVSLAVRSQSEVPLPFLDLFQTQTYQALEDYHTHQKWKETEDPGRSYKRFHFRCCSDMCFPFPEPKTLRDMVPVRYRPIAAGQRSPHPHESAHAQGTCKLFKT